MFYYYGAKHRYAAKYPPPLHRIVVEPFAGSAGYSLYHLQRGNIDGAILIEKDPRVIELWQRLLLMSPAEVLAIPRPEPGTITEDFLWMTAAASNALAKLSRYKFTERANGVAEAMLKRIAKMLPFVQGRVLILEASYEEAPDIEATWFIDPPYQPTNGSHALSQGKGYAHGCDSASIDYDALGVWCQERRGQVIVCEQEGADWLPFQSSYWGFNTIGVKSHEVIWTKPWIKKPPPPPSEEGSPIPS